MKTTEYLQKHGISMRALADKVGVVHTRLTKPLNGHAPVIVDLAFAVEEATEGEISADDFVLDIIQARRTILAQQQP